MKFLDLVKVFVGLFLGLFGLLISLGSLLAWEEKGKDSFGHLVAAVGLGVLPMVAGAMLCGWAWTSWRRRSGEATERQILSLARAKGGVLSAQILALESELTLREAEEALRECFESGHCTMDFGEGGVPVYIFGALG